jgi:hypothetical protein
VIQNTELLRDAGLVDVDLVDQVAHRTLAVAERLEEAPSGRVGEDLEQVGHET